MDRAIPDTEPEYQYLVVDRKALFEELSQSKIDPKKATWIPDEKDGYVLAEIESTKGDDISVRTEKGDVKTLKKDLAQDVNPQKYEQATDMADLSQLNEASILHNLRSRYFHKHIYTYSGLFCVVINPYKFLPIYTDAVIGKYRGKRRTEMPPHLYAIADGAFSYMLTDRENQSILITGESGAGKTENTKKVIQYFAKVAAAQAAADAAKGVVDDAAASKKGSLEEQIVGCNPPLEAYGNAKTVRNNNSSRFGKFIRIHFGPTGKIAGADIEHYLLEKSRVTACGRLERNYHIFYQLCSIEGGKPYHEKLLVKPDVGLYSFCNQGVLTVDGIDDNLEMKATSDALDTLGFTEEEKLSIFKCVGAIMYMGEMKFKQSKDEQAEADGTAEAEKASFLLGINATDMIKCLTKPKVKVGTEWVNKSQNKEQVVYAVATLSKSLYSRLFDWLVKRCNQTLDTKARRQYFIGVLDIAGFEIFEFNSFEQLAINYTNERLQQFFNHHMFVLEQEEYKKEGIDWVFIDFGLDLAACIELIEKPLGILSILEEECIVPKGSDKSLVEKLCQNHLGKSPNFLKPGIKKGTEKGKEPHFELKHYAGCVAYNCNGWLERNKDPINACTVELMSSSKDALVPVFFPAEPEEAAGGKKKKGGAMQTISAAHRESLNRLMKNLYSTHPHFVRCLIPNELKQSWYVDAALVLNQLKCNGVLEGIRICRKGFPNRMIYPDFKQRYTILAPNAVPAGFVDAKVVAEKVLGALTMGETDYRLGHTKVFFRAGILAKLEEWREEKLSAILSYFQSNVRAYLMRKKYRKLIDQRTALARVQLNIRKYMAFKDWKWWKMYTLIKPLLAEQHSEDEMRQKEEEFEKTKSELERITKLAKELEEQNVTLLQAKNDMFITLQSTQDSIGEMEEKLTMALTQGTSNEDHIKELEDRLQEEENRGAQGENFRSKLEGEIDHLKDANKELENTVAKAEQDKTAKDTQIRKLQEDLAAHDQTIAKLSKDGKSLDETLKKARADIQAEETKVADLTKAKQKVEQALSETEESLAKEKKIRGDVEKVKAKLERDLKMTQDAVAELDRVKRELEELVRKKDGEIATMQGKVEEDSNLIAQLQKKNKDLQRRIEELEEELEAERGNRVKVEKQRAELQRELEDLSMRLDEAGGATAAQVELNKRREAELAKMRVDMEEAKLQNEQAMAVLKKKNVETVNQLTDAVETATKNRQRVEKEKQQIKAEVDDLHSQLDSIAKAKAFSDKTAKSLEANLSDVHGKMDEQSRAIAELTAQRARSAQDATDFQRQLEEAQAQITLLDKAKQQFQASSESAKAALEDEIRSRAKFQAESRALQSDIEHLRAQIDEEVEGKNNMQRLLAKAQQEMQQLKARAAAGEFGGGEPSEEMKKKFAAKMQEAEAHIESSRAKVATLEKQKARLQAELEDIAVVAERAQTSARQAEKKQKAMDKVIAEYQAKIDSLNIELEQAQQQSRGFSAEVYTLRAKFEEAHDVTEGLRRENKNLSDEIRELMDQLSEGGKSVHEAEKMRRRLEAEKAELQAALDEAALTIENEGVKQQRLQMELARMRGDIEKRLAEKDEENEMSRKNMQRMLESLQATLEAETRVKVEALKGKKKLESNITELETALNMANKSRIELEKNTKRFQVQVIEIQQRLEQETVQRDELREQLMAMERRAATVQSEFEESSISLEQADRRRKQLEGELHESHVRFTDMQAQNTQLLAVKRKLEADFQAITSDLDDAVNELKSHEEKAKRFQAESARLAGELHAAHDHSTQMEHMRKQLEQQVKEMQSRVDELETTAMKAGHRQVATLEQRMREMEAELENEQRAHQETAKIARRAEQQLKEVVMRAEEEVRSRDQMQEMINQLQGKLKVYKRQVEEAEEIASVNLAKYRKVQVELEDSSERAEVAEQTVCRMRMQTLNSSSTMTIERIISE